MSLEHLNVLLVEDGETDKLLIRNRLASSEALSVELVEAASIAEALEQLQQRRFDIVLLDLGLPDSFGFESFVKVYETHPDAAVIILTGCNDERLAMQIVNSGAQDYLIKEETNRAALLRSIRYAVERHRAQREIRELRQREIREREVMHLEGYADSHCPAGPGRRIDLELLSHSSPEVFNELVASYRSVVAERMKEELSSKAEQSTTELVAVAERVGMLSGGPRDIIDIHLSALHQIRSKKGADAVDPMEAGRMVVLELMGCLVSYYRFSVFGKNREEAGDSISKDGSRLES